MFGSCGVAVHSCVILLLLCTRSAFDDCYGPQLDNQLGDASIVTCFHHLHNTPAVQWWYCIAIGSDYVDATSSSQVEMIQCPIGIARLHQIWASDFVEVKALGFWENLGFARQVRYALQ